MFHVKRGQRADIALEYLNMYVELNMSMLKRCCSLTFIVPSHHSNEGSFKAAFDPAYKMGHTALLKAVHDAQEKRDERVKCK